MTLLNLGAGATRPGPPWVNLDSLRSVLPEGTPERDQLNRESNYVDYDLRGPDPWPFPANHFDGILASHLLEHFDVLEGTKLLKNCLNSLTENGLLMISVPDASYHRSVYDRDTRKNAYKLFGEPMPEHAPQQTFLEYALFFIDHRTVYTEDSLWAMLVNAGFKSENVSRLDAKERDWPGDKPLHHMHALLNRRMFSLVMVAIK